MTILHSRAVRARALPYARLARPDRLGAVLLDAAALALAGRDCGTLAVAPPPGRYRRWVGRHALPVHQAGHLDAEKVAWDITARYRQARYPGVVIGAPHGAAVHLAAALGMPWLPDRVELSLRWPDGAADDPTGALIHGLPAAAALLANNPQTTVRQVHDPAADGVAAGSTITLVAHWRRLPAAYRAFLGRRLDPGAPALVIGDARRWPAFDAGGGHTFQVGHPSGGVGAGQLRQPGPALRHVLRHTGGDPERWRPPGASATGAAPDVLTGDLERYAAAHGVPLKQIWYDDPHALSAGTADVYRRWLPAAGKTGDRVVVECGTLLDPYQVIRAGLVPYWCESPVAAAAGAADRWLAESGGGTSVDVLPQPPGCQHPAPAPIERWDEVAGWGRRRGVVDATARRRYPARPLPTRHATRVLRNHAYDPPRPPPLTLATALYALRERADQGLLVT